MKMDYMKDMFIDETALDIEILEHGEKAIRYGEYFAECKDKVSKCDERLKVIRSELIDKVNRNPDKYLGTGNKPTALTVEAYFRNHPSHQKAKEELFEAQHELDIAEIAKNEISYTRKTMLELLVKLHGQNYFAGPKVPRDLHEERRNRNESTQSANRRIRIR